MRENSRRARRRSRQPASRRADNSRALPNRNHGLASNRVPRGTQASAAISDGDLRHDRHRDHCRDRHHDRLRDLRRGQVRGRRHDRHRSSRRGRRATRSGRRSNGDSRRRSRPDNIRPDSGRPDNGCRNGASRATRGRHPNRSHNVRHSRTSTSRGLASRRSTSSSVGLPRNSSWAARRSLGHRARSRVQARRISAGRRPEAARQGRWIRTPPRRRGKGLS